LSAGQWVAIGIATIAVGVLTVDYGHPPYFALTLAGSFGLYGLIKNRLRVPAADGLTLEAALLALPAAGYLVFLGAQGQATLGHVSIAHTVIVITSGAVTSGPLLLFAGAAKRLPLSAIGLLQYIAPILQLAVGVLIIHEPMPPARLVGFGLVWAALAVFTWDGIRRLRSATRTTAIDSSQPVPAAGVPTA
jgi:chloramphenicol-sensitive protein RarD